MPTVAIPFPEIRDQVVALGLDVLIHTGEEVPAGFERAQFVVVPNQGLEPTLQALTGDHDVRVVQVLSSGVDHVLSHIPPAATLCSAATLHAAAVAEFALSLVLASLNRLPTFLLAQNDRGRRWAEREPRQGLSGKHVVMLGAGHVGKRTTGLLRACGAAVTLVARSGRAGVRPVCALEDLLPTADVLMIAVPLNQSTRHLIGGRELALLPDGALVVNVARGAVLETGALVRELTSGRLMAALDVTDPEPLPPQHPLWDCDGVIITPHMGGKMAEFRARAGVFLTDQLSRYARGEPLSGIVRCARDVVSPRP